MIVDLDSALEDCLERLARGETLQSCIEQYPDLATDLLPLLRAATRLGEQTQLSPSPRFKSRTRSQLFAHMEAHPRGNRLKQISWWPTFRLAIGLAILLIAFALTGTVWAQSALPGTPFYSWKLASERVGRAISPDPVGFDLTLAEKRANEAIAVSGNAAAQEIAVKEYQRVIQSLKEYHDAAVQARIEPVLEVQKQKLESAGIFPGKQEIPSPIDTLALTPIDVPTQLTLPSLKATLTIPIPSVTPIIPKVLPSETPVISIPTIKSTAPGNKTPLLTLPVPTLKVTVPAPTLQKPTLISTLPIPTISLSAIPGIP